MMIRFKQDYKEALLRSIIALLFIGLILGLSMRKILIAFGINTAEPLVSMNINYTTSIPAWSSFVCGNFSKVEAQTLKRGPTGTHTDVATPLPQDHIQQATTNSLITGDWTAGGVWPCFIFNPKGINFKPGENDSIILVISSDTPQGDNANGLIFGVFDEERNISSVEPFVAPTPSTNTYTFTRSERVDVNNKLHSYFSVNKQNLVKLAFAAESGVAAKFEYSPDTYLVVKYTEKMAYTPYDLISAIGGLITYALAAWFILFGRGKYRSWGLIQRYLLRSSPNARKKNGNQLLPSYNNNNEKAKTNSETIENQSQINSNHDTFVNDDRSSIYYFSSTGTPTKSNFNFNDNNNSNNNNNNNNYLSPTSISSSQQYLKDLDKRIDAKINEKLWSVEQTLSKHYLAGFKLRKYDVDSKKFGFDYLSFFEEENNDKQILTPPTIHSWNLDSGRTLGDHNIRKFRSTSSLSQVYSNNNDISNPEEQRSQYPNVSIDQVPLEKKQRGRNSGNYQNNNNNILTNEINNNNGPTPSSSSSNNVNNNNSNITNYTNYTPQGVNNNNNHLSLSQLSSVYYGSK